MNQLLWKKKLNQSAFFPRFCHYIHTLEQPLFLSNFYHCLFLVNSNVLLMGFFFSFFSFSPSPIPILSNFFHLSDSILLFPFFNLFLVKSFSPSFHFFEKKLSSFIATWNDLSWSSLLPPFRIPIKFRERFLLFKSRFNFSWFNSDLFYAMIVTKRNTDSV